MIISEQIIKQKIDEYIFLMQKCGYINNRTILTNVRNKLYSLKIERIYNAPGDANINGTTLKLCHENIQKQISKKGNYYLDEVLFHEFTHAFNSFHNAIYGENSFLIEEYIQNRMNNFNTIRLVKDNDELLYNQDPCFGVVLLDEFIAQNIAQQLILYKLSILDENTKTKYTLDKNLNTYKLRLYKTDICEPPMTIETSLADYPEYYTFAYSFINKHRYNIHTFIKESLNPDFFKNFINKLNDKELSNLYIELCYLGIIHERYSLLNGFTNISDKNDPAHNPRKVHKVMSKLLKK